MSKMIERVARVMAEGQGWRWDDDKQMLDCAAAGLQNTSRERDSWRNRARAAIEAMRRPTRDVLTSFVDADVSVQDAAARWDCAITAALAK